MFLIPIADIDFKVTIVPQANRYLLELDMAACLLFAVITCRLLSYSPKPLRIAIYIALGVLTDSSGALLQKLCPRFDSTRGHHENG